MHFLERPSHLLFLLLALPPHSNADIAKPTSIYIDLVPRYKNLSACAEAPLSSLVRNMWNGCGDNSELTSYSCFCTDSYSKFSWDISTAVVGSCGSAFGAAQATSAVSVFHNYCANGTTQLSSSAVVTTAMGSGSSTGGTVTSIPVAPPTTSRPKISPESIETAVVSAATGSFKNAPRPRLFIPVVGVAVVRMLF